LHGELLRKAVVHELIAQHVDDVLQTAGAALIRFHWESLEEARCSAYRLGPSRALAAQKAELEAFLARHVYRHPHIIAVRGRAQARLRAMFAGYCRKPALLPPSFRERAEAIGIARAVGDYVAGMTDRFCERQYFTHFATPGERPAG
jgi:dGTPase